MAVAASSKLSQHPLVVEDVLYEHPHHDRLRAVSQQVLLTGPHGPQEQLTDRVGLPRSWAPSKHGLHSPDVRRRRDQRPGQELREVHRLPPATFDIHLLLMNLPSRLAAVLAHGGGPGLDDEPVALARHMPAPSRDG